MYRALLVLVTLLALLLGGCGGGGYSVKAPALSRVSLDTGRASQKTIGPAGGVVTAQDRNGVRYTLTIPPDALLGQHAITMFPIEGISGLPGGEPTQAGVHLLPEGLTFNRPVTLTLDFPAPIDKTRTAAMAYTGDAQRLQGYPFAIAGNRLTVLLSHFSGYAAVNPQDLLTTPSGFVGGVRIQHLIAAEIAAANEAGTDPTSQIIRLMTEWVETVILPEIQSFNRLTDGAGAFEEIDVIVEEVLSFFMTGLVLTGNDNTLDQAIDDLLTRCKAALRTSLEHAIVLINNHADAQLQAGEPIDVGLDAVDQSFKILTMAKFFGVRDGALAITAVLERVPVEPVVLSLFIDEDFRQGRRAELDVRAGIKVRSTGFVDVSKPMPVQVRFDGRSIGRPSEGTTRLGQFVSQIDFPPQVSILTLEARVSLPLTQFSLDRQRESDDLLFFSASDTIRRPVHLFAGTYSGTARGEGTANGERIVDVASFTAEVDDSGRLTATGDVIRGTSGGQQRMPFQASGILQENGDADFSGTAGEGNAVCPFTFRGRFEIRNGVRRGAGTFAVACPNGNNTSGDWECSTEPPRD